ncbi:MAG: hypothetical protein ABI687_10385 [Flavitalea sp.]
MKTFIFWLLTLAMVSAGYAQPSKAQRIEDSVIGWWNNNRFDNGLKTTSDPVQLRRVAQLDKLVQWVKKSYTPVAGLGTFRRENLKTSFGVRFMIWNVRYDPLWLDDKGHFTPVSEEQTSFGIHFNTIPGSYPIPFLNGTGVYYFTWPANGFRINSSAESLQANSDPKIHPNVYKYITRSNESQIVILAPNNKLPFVQLTRGEYLDAAESSLDKAFEKEKKRIEQQGPNPALLAAQQKQFAGYRSQIASLKKKYASRLNDPAIIRSMQATLSDFNGNVDPFDISERERGLHSFHEVYKVPLEVMQQAQSDKPQWLAAWFPFVPKERGNQLYELYRSMTENVNYDYLYDYFFDPGAVKNKEYKPNDEEGLNKRLAEYRNKYKSR